MMKTNISDTLKLSIFDMDGVITKTAITHCKAWKSMFDEYLHYRETTYNEPFVEFSIDEDYKLYVDGRPRYEGVNAFLNSRNINIEYGNESDCPGLSTICSLGNLKNEKFSRLIELEGVELYDSTIALIKELKSRNIMTAVASSSRNCKTILEKMGILDLFDVAVDGNDLSRLNLKGKPDPAIFTTAADLLNCNYSNAIVFEDAISGVQAGRNGNFGLVVGIAREHPHHEMLSNGADHVVNDLAELNVDAIVSMLKLTKERDGHNFSYNCIDNSKEGANVSLHCLGNGYVNTRGSICFLPSTPINYKATYLSGVYNRLESVVNGRTIENEDLVNCGEIWNVEIAVTTFKNNEKVVSIINSPTQIKSFNKNLSLRDGSLETDAVVEDECGNQLNIRVLQCVSMYDKNIAAARYSIKPLNFDGLIDVKTSINCNVRNLGVERYNTLNNSHLIKRQDYVSNDRNTTGIEVETINSAIKIGISAKTICKTHDVIQQVIVEDSAVISNAQIEVHNNETVIIEKIISIFNSKQDIDYQFVKAVDHTRRYSNYIDVLENSSAAWHRIWQKIDIHVDNRLEQKITRLYLYHLMIAFSPHNKDLDAGLGPRGLTGESYRGHIFWDEIMVMPFYAKHFPQTAKAMLMYRYNRIEKAKEAAQQDGYQGAMFPWQSGSDGREESQIIHYNPISGCWDDDNSRHQRHVSLAIAYNIYQYWKHTKDEDFMISHGICLLFEICRFWASKSLHSDDGKYHIHNVMGPDEFHEKMPSSKQSESNKFGLSDNAYTNIMVSWLMMFAKDVNSFFHDRLSNLYKTMNVDESEIEKWSHIGSNLYLSIKEGIIAQFDGFLEMQELDFEVYKSKYGNIERIDRILKSEGKSPDDYQVCKQADLIMAFYNFPIESDGKLFSYSLSDIFDNMGYRIDNEIISNNFDYYLSRTTHGSTLSKVVFSKVAKALGRVELAQQLWKDAIRSDFFDKQGTTKEGIHIGVMSCIFN